ncbi:hypothetical protein [Edaphocola aurantiacus]|uniref:hypothetical protein n=1 Tax=Edaphocola aurantiacus TaxID=2601682 RepID=UPI001C96F9BE|nr:hypothetical protein [Edaphocola aurantiacus]
MSNRKQPYQQPKPNEEEALWQYVSGDLPPEKAHLLEADKVDDPFWNDAVEGLQQLGDSQKIRKVTAQLKQQAHKTAGSKDRKKSMQRHQQHNILITVLILLLLLVCYCFFHFGAK